jgi:ubiquitin-conjugating enzyme E2 D/E
MGGSNEKSEEQNISEEEALEKEYRQLKECDELPINNCEYVNNDKKHWKIVFEGSKYSPYEDGYFTLELLFNKGTFPKYGPEAKFITKMFHPNIDSNGHVCINHLNSWNSSISIISVIFGILEILDNPVPSGGYSNEARKLLETDEEKYYKKVQEYTMTYAKKPININ